MPNIAAARAELKHIEAVLRTRYRYEHSIFGYIAAALSHLEDEPPPAKAEALAEAPAEAEAPSETEAEAPAESEAPAPRGRRRS